MDKRNTFGRKQYRFILIRKDPSGQHMFVASPLSDQIVHSFVVVHDGSAFMSVVLQIATANRTERQGLCSLFSVEPKCSQYILRMINTAKWFPACSPGVPLVGFMALCLFLVLSAFPLLKFRCGV